jgi:large repetitive protein
MQETHGSLFRTWLITLLLFLTACTQLLGDFETKRGDGGLAPRSDAGGDSGGPLPQQGPIVVTPMMGLVTSEAGRTAQFTIVLKSRPTSNVAIALRSSNTNEGTINRASVTFSRDNWSAPQTVIVTGVDDTVVDGNKAYTIITSPATTSIADDVFRNVDPPDVSVTNVDDESAGFTISPDTGLTTTESGGEATFTVVLNTAPKGNVTIRLSSSDEKEGKIAPLMMIFTPQNWRSPQMATVTGVDDGVPDGKKAYRIMTGAAVSPMDVTYDKVDPDDIDVVNEDDDTAGFTVKPISGLLTNENGQMATFTMALNFAPTANVVVRLTSSNTNEGIVSPTTLTFTPVNWKAPQVVTVSGLNDAVADGNQPFEIRTAPAESGDAAYNQLDPPDVSVTNIDDDSAGITVKPAEGLVTTEAGGDAKFTIVLNSRPSQNVVVGLSSSLVTEGTVSPASVTFTATNWNAPQTVTVTGVDDAVADGNQPYLVRTAKAVSTDPDYSDLDGPDVKVTNNDNDSAGFIVMPTMGLVTTEKGDFATFTVSLTSKPTQNVRIAMESSNPAEGTVSPALLTFTPDNYRASQTVTVTGVDDRIEDGNQVYRITTGTADSMDVGYAGLPVPDVELSNTDDDSAGISVRTVTTPFETSEKGDTAVFTVVLNSQPTAPVTIPVVSADAEEGTVSPTQLVFTADNWNAPRTVTITGVDDAVQDGNQEYRITIAAATSMDAKYNMLDVPDLVAINVDNDVAGITVRPPAMPNTSERGTSTTFTVELNSQPTAPVTIRLTSSMPAEGTMSPAELHFNATDWNAPQVVTVTGVDDRVADGNQPYTIVTQPSTSTDINYNDVNAPDVAITNLDDDSPGFIVTPTTPLTTNEDGASATFTVQLQSQPVADVTIGVRSNDTGEGRTDVTSLVFTAANYSAPHTVTVTGVNDDVADGNQAYRVMLDPATSADMRYNGLNPVDVVVSNTDNDSPGITVSPPAGNTREDGATTTFTVRLTSQPAGTATVTIPLSSSNPNEGTIMQPSLVFTTANWAAFQTVTVRGVDDNVADGNQQYRAILGAAASADMNYAGLDAPDVVLINVDNDKAGITVSVAAGNTTEAGGTTTFSVVLDSQPTANVTIPMSSSNTNEGTVMQPSLVFTTVNWAAPQTVTVRGVNDNIADGNQLYRIILGAASGGDYAGIDPPDVNVTNVDDDSPGFIVTPRTGLVTTESGGTATFTVRLTSEPIANVSLGVHSNDVTEGATNVASLTFTPANYNSPQTVTVRGVNDDVADGNQTYRIILDPAMSTDPNYNNRNPGDVTVSNTDNDSAGITVTPTTGLSTGENGSTASFTVVLNSQPTADVTIPLSSTNTAEGTVSPASIVFTAANWSAPRTITVRGVDDAVQDGSPVYRIVVGPATSADTNYANRSGADVSLTNVDNDTAGISATPTSGLSTAENGTTASFTVVLNSQPTADVTIAVSSSNVSEGTVSEASLVFTSANWAAPRTVTLRGVDDAVQDGNNPYVITVGPATSGDGNYNARFGPDVHAINVDNDSAGITVTPTTGLTTGENGTTASFTVVLNSQPTAVVDVPIVSTMTSEGTVSAASLTFTAANWSSPRTVTVRGVDDAVQDGDRPYLVNVGPAMSGDTNYNGRTGSDVQVTNVDNDSAGITIAPATSPASRLSTLESGATVTFTVVLNSQPTAGVTIPLSSSNTFEGTVSPASIAFSTTDWAAPKTVTLQGIDDAVHDGDQPYVVTVGPATSTDPNYNTRPGGDVYATNVDNDTAGITVAPVTGPSSRLSTTENAGTAAFTVVLNSQPTGTVTIPVASNLATEGAPTVASISFSTSDWSAPKTVTVRGADDAVQDGDRPYQVTVGPATSTDTNYNNRPVGDVYLTNIDNDTAGITVSPVTSPTNRLSTGENGATATFTVVLNSEPTNTVTIPLTSLMLNDECTISPAFLVFSSSDWNGAKTVTVRGFDDAVQDGDIPYMVNVGPATSGDGNYNGRAGDDVYLTNVDNDTAGITIAPTTAPMNRLVTHESGSPTPTFTVVLTSQPIADVIVPIVSSSTAEGTVSPPSPLTFTAANWNAPQTVTLHGVNDFVQDGDQPYEINVGPASSTDPNYQARPGGVVYCTNVDNDTAGITVTPVTSPSSRLQTYENGSANATFTIVLNAQPTSSVSIPLGSTVPVEGVPCAFPTLPPSCTASVSFTTSDWSTPKTVTIVGANDSVQDGNQPYQITIGPSSSADINYSNRTAPDVYALNNDDDVANIVVSGLSPPGNTTELGLHTEFTVVLTTQPVAPVTVNFTSTATTEGTLSVGGVSASGVTFNPSGAGAWNQPQTVRITGVDDFVDDGDQPYAIQFAVTTMDGPYGMLPPPSQINLTNVDNDAAGINLTLVSPAPPLTCTTATASPATFAVTLRSQPTGNVTIDLSTDNMARGTIAPPATLVFTNTTGNWNTPQTFTVNGSLEPGGYGVTAAPNIDSMVTTDANYRSLSLAQSASCTNL